MQVSKKVHALRIPFYITGAGVTAERFVYVYLIYGSEVCLIDAGVSGSERMIFDYLRNTDRRVSDVALIIQSHSHPDHIGATRAIKAETGCAVAAHPAEKAWIEDIEQQFRQRPVPGFHSLVSGPVAVDRSLQDGDVVDLGCGLKLQVIHTPGHSRGSVSLLLPGYNILFSGDSVPVPGEMPLYEDALASIRSIKRLKELKDIRQLLASWDEPRKGDGVYERLDEGLHYLQRIHDSVIRLADKNGREVEPMELCKSVLEDIGIPGEAANPIVAKSIASHLPLREQKKII